MVFVEEIIKFKLNVIKIFNSIGREFNLGCRFNLKIWNYVIFKNLVNLRKMDNLLKKLFLCRLNGLSAVIGFNKLI